VLTKAGVQLGDCIIGSFRCIVAAAQMILAPRTIVDCPEREFDRIQTLFRIVLVQEKVCEILQLIPF
jgi:hypothetical protein